LLNPSLNIRKYLQRYTYYFKITITKKRKDNSLFLQITNKYMDNENKFIIIRIVCVSFIYMLGVYTAPFLPNDKIIKGIATVVLLLLAVISFYIIGCYQKRKK